MMTGPTADENESILQASPSLAPARTLLEAEHVAVDQTVADFGAFSKTYNVIRFGPRAGLVALRKAGDADEVLLVGQYRFLPNRLCWELPGGRVEAGEDPAIAAVRECREETGFLCRSVRPLVAYYPGLDNVDNRTDLYMSEDVTEVEAFVPDPAEVCAIQWVAFDEAVRMVVAGVIQDALSVVGILAHAAALLGGGAKPRNSSGRKTVS